MKKSHLIPAIVAAVLFGWVIVHIDLSKLGEQLKGMRVAVPIIIALSGLRLVLQSIAWSASMKGEGLSVEKTKLMAVRLASQSMGYLTVLGPVVSEPMKIKLLGTRTEPTISATLLDDGVYWFTSASIAILGIVSLPLVAAHGALYHSVPAILALAFIMIVISRREPILSFPLRVLGAHAPSWLARAERVESSIRAYRLNQPALVSRMFRFDVACQLLIAAEVVVVLWALHLPIQFVAVLVIEGVTRAVKLVSGWIPARLGSDEGGAISAFTLMGFSPILGLTLALTRRMRDLLWALIGIMWLAWNSRSSSHPKEILAASFAKEAL